jgi:hypothetical protein
MERELDARFGGPLADLVEVAREDAFSRLRFSGPTRR